MNGSMNQRRIWKAVAVAVLASCTTGAVAKADKTGSDTVVLQLATIDGIEHGGPAAETFVDALAEVSDGSIQVELTEAFHEGDADAESRLIEAIAAGDIDGGWPATRRVRQRRHPRAGGDRSADADRQLRRRTASS